MVVLLLAVFIKGPGTISYQTIDVGHGCNLRTVLITVVNKHRCTYALAKQKSLSSLFVYLSGWVVATHFCLQIMLHTIVMLRRAWIREKAEARRTENHLSLVLT